MRSVISDYLEAIYTLHAEGEEAYGVTLAELFGVSRANASATVLRLARDGLAAVEGRRVALTDQGREGAEAGLRRHQITECFLIDVLRLDWATVHEEARSFARGLTPLLEERIDLRLGFPRTCPHGNPVPRPDLDAARFLRDQHAMRMSQAPTGSQLRILAISELLEGRPERLRFCAEHGLRPGASFQIQGAAPGAAGDLLVRNERGQVAVETALTTRIWVVAEEGIARA